MDEYPSEEDLKQIREWKLGGSGSYYDLARFIIALWWNGDVYARLWGRKLKLHTCGWSGNEDIIAALREQGDPVGFWAVCWDKSQRGGHYWFELPNPKTFDTKSKV
jgi:hypothetical protein